MFIRDILFLLGGCTFLLGVIILGVSFNLFVSLPNYIGTIIKKNGMYLAQKTMGKHGRRDYKSWARANGRHPVKKLPTSATHYFAKKQKTSSENDRADYFECTGYPLKNVSEFFFYPMKIIRRRKWM